MSKYCYLIILLIISILTSGQVAVGQWRDHLPYTYGKMVAEGGDKVYVVTNVGLFSYDKNSSETQKMSKIAGLSDVGPSAIAYSKEYNELIIGYSNGNLDIISNNSIYNLADIKRKSLTASKSINNILFIDDYAYLSCGFGIVVYDLSRKEIKDTYYIGNNGGFVEVNEITTDGSNLYAATTEGIYKGNLTDNLVDFSYWQMITELPTTSPFNWMSGSNFNTIEYFQDKLIANYRDPEGLADDILLVYSNNEWNHFDTSINVTNSLWSNETDLCLSSEWYIKLYDSTFENYRHVWKYYFYDGDASLSPYHTIIGEDGVIWTADRLYGLVKSSASWSHVKISINGPSSNDIFAMDAMGDELKGIPGGYNLSLVPQYKNASYFNFTDSWSTVDYKTEPALSGKSDFVSIKINPRDPSNIFIGSWIFGLFEFRNNELVNIFNETNSPLLTITGTDFIRVGGLDFDEDNNLWASCSDNQMPIVVKMANGDWHGLNYKSEMNASNVGDLIVASNGYKWVILPRGGGLFVFDDKGTPEDINDDDTRKLSIYNEYGETISNEVFSIAEDRDGSIWVGTNQGLVVYYNPDDVFTQGSFYAHQVKIPRNDGTNDADLLLSTETVTAICIDGANNKWFGTRAGGVFKTSSSGVEQMHHFNTDNSPILSNNIYCMQIVPGTGEVFIGTDKGIISYRGEATEGDEDYTDVYAFPNPVEPDYNGPITIHGLIAGSYVKITDISGNIVYEMRSQGGQAIWQGTDFNGNRVKTGVYLVFASNEDGSKKTVTKILFIN